MPLSLVMLWLKHLNKDSLVGHSSLRQILGEFFVVSFSLITTGNALCMKKYNNVVKQAAIHVYYSILKIIIENTDPYSSFRRAKTTFKRYIPAIGVRLEYSVN